MTCFTKLPNRGMADLVWEVLGEPAGVPAQWLGSFPPRETAFLGMHTRVSSKISQGVGLEASSPLCLEDKLKPMDSLAGLGC